MLRSWIQRVFRSEKLNKPSTNLDFAIESLENRQLLATLIVDAGDPDANDPGDNLFAEIQDAIDAAESGDRIKVHSGEYQPFVVYTDRLTIQEATPKSNPVVDGSSQSIAVEIRANGTTVKGLHIHNAVNYGMYIERSDNKISGVVVDGVVDGVGITLFDARDNKLEKNIVAGAEIGFWLLEASNNTVSKNTAMHNETGFQIEDTSNDNHLVGNKASTNDNDGFRIMSQSHGNVLSRNTASHNHNGIGVYGSAFNTLSRNVVQGNGFDGIIVVGDSNEVANNLATDNVRAGIIVYAADNNNVTANRAIGNGTGIFSAFGDNNTISRNRSEGNLYGFQLSDGTDGNTLDRNIAKSNIRSGFRYNNVGGLNRTVRNKSIDNGRYGFELNTINGVFDGNTCNSNALGPDNFNGFTC